MGKKKREEHCEELGRRMSAGNVDGNVGATKGQVAEWTWSAIMFLFEKDVRAPLLIQHASPCIACLAIGCVVFAVLSVDVLAVGLIVCSVVHEV